MCGILGVISKFPQLNRDWVKLGSAKLNHRGPDDFGEWWSIDRRIGFGHRRLAIIDLSRAGHQPMHDVSGNLTIVFNGEIYNFKELRQELENVGYRFRTVTDTEVILNSYTEWGTDCVSHFNGMFAFAIFDSDIQQVFMARDRAGEKPLFYSLVDGTLRFASELKALMSDPSFSRCIDPQSLDCYLAMGYVPGDRCILKDVSKLPPAHSLIFNMKTGHKKVWRYWQLPVYENTGESDYNEIKLIDELENLLEDSVKRQLIADVPVGILLSGGVDSSLVTALAARNVNQVKTFTIRFPGYGNYDETEHARLIANYFGTSHMELEAAETTVDLLPILAKQFDEPMVDSSMIPTFLVSQLIRQHCTVALGGDGGDELFGGYNHYDRLLWMEQKLGWIPLAWRSAIALMGGLLLPVGFKGRNWLQGFSVDLEKGVPLIASLFDIAARRKLLNEYRDWSPKAEVIRELRFSQVGDLLQNATRMDFENYLAEDILVKVDRASMLNSLEVRAPILDYRLVEFAFGKVPPSLKATVTTRKILLKKLCTRLLPQQFDQQRKQGFSIPLANWLDEGPWYDLFHDILLDSSNGLFDKKFVRSLLNGQKKGRSNSERLFALALFELWRKEYKVSI